MKELHDCLSFASGAFTAKLAMEWFHASFNSEAVKISKEEIIFILSLSWVVAKFIGF